MATRGSSNDNDDGRKHRHANTTASSSGPAPPPSAVSKIAMELKAADPAPQALQPASKPAAPAESHSMSECDGGSGIGYEMGGRYLPGRSAGALAASHCVVGISFPEELEDVAMYVTVMDGFSGNLMHEQTLYAKLYFQPV